MRDYLSETAKKYFRVQMDICKYKYMPQRKQKCFNVARAIRTEYPDLQTMPADVKSWYESFIVQSDWKVADFNAAWDRYQMNHKEGGNNDR